jgi:hypothetical protein
MNAFWDKVNRCKHENLNPNYLESFGCETPYCGGFEMHCLDCGVYISKCKCGYCSNMSGWPRKRHFTEMRKIAEEIVELA